jgi:ribosome maturation protein Sdo1
MNAKAREIWEEVKRTCVYGDTDDRNAESIIAEALAEKDKEIARMREAIEYALRQEGAR